MEKNIQLILNKEEDEREGNRGDVQTNPNLRVSALNDVEIVQQNSGNSDNMGQSPVNQ